MYLFFTAMLVNVMVYAAPPPKAPTPPKFKIRLGRQLDNPGPYLSNIVNFAPNQKIVLFIGTHAFQYKNRQIFQEMAFFDRSDKYVVSGSSPQTGNYYNFIKLGPNREQDLSIEIDVSEFWQLLQDIKALEKIGSAKITSDLEYAEVVFGMLIKTVRSDRKTELLKFEELKEWGVISNVLSNLRDGVGVPNSMLGAGIGGTGALAPPPDLSSGGMDCSRALSSVIIPTSLSGKSRFLASFLRVAGAARIEAAALLAGLVSGKLELRDRSRWIGEEGNDDFGTKGPNHSRSKDSLDKLILLMKGSLEVDEYQFKLKVGKKMWASVASWVVLAGYGGTTTAPKTKGVDFLQSTRYVQRAPSGQHAPIIRSIQPFYSESTMRLDLDFVPYASFESTVKAFIHSMPLSENQNIDAVLEFTVLAPHVEWLSREYVLCAIPFMYTNGRNANSIIKSDATPPPTLTPTPMLLSLKQVIENLTSLSSSSSLQILSCTKTSSEWSLSLREIVRERDLVGLDGGLNFKGHAHSECGGYRGCEEESSSWMRERSMMLWQAVILRAGWVQR
ncbi:hypothetical protein C8J55DRAFT_494337 [Lentinula edodes]|uniref:Uncharacterized protein n=1 Tax=Lentinula lateritia TaxID=40482 RepID=A0A9W8ZP81_9AGAR|nr:hypothetical protein C8J55DRAFT_494337 [Lentinula edodes]